MDTCTAKSKQSQQRCKNRPTPGRNVCRFHGGKTAIAGATHHAWKDGRRSKYIPPRIAEKYQDSLTDPQLTEYRQDLALLEARLYEVLASGESQVLWAKAQEAFVKLRDGMASKDDERIGDGLTMLESLINRGMADSLRWAEVYRVMEQLGKTKEREHKRMVQAQLMITSEQLIVMLAQVADVARRTFTNREEIRTFANALNSLGLVDPRRDVGSTQ